MPATSMQKQPWQSKVTKITSKKKKKHTCTTQTYKVLTLNSCYHTAHSQFPSVCRKTHSIYHTHWQPFTVSHKKYCTVHMHLCACVCVCMCKCIIPSLLKYWLLSCLGFRVKDHVLPPPFNYSVTPPPTPSTPTHIHTHTQISPWGRISFFSVS